MTPYRAQDIHPPVAITPELRHNASQHEVVARGIATLGESGIMPAVEYLKLHGVRPQVIERVLLEPERRRAVA